VCLNAGAALIVAGLADDLADGLEIGRAVETGTPVARSIGSVAVSNAAAEDSLG